MNKSNQQTIEDPREPKEEKKGGYRHMSREQLVMHTLWWHLKMQQQFHNCVLPPPGRGKDTPGRGNNYLAMSLILNLILIGVLLIGVLLIGVLPL